MSKRNPYAEGAPFLATGGFRTAAQRLAEDKAAAPKPQKPSQQKAIPPLGPGESPKINDYIAAERLRMKR